jgi:adenylate cyclase class 2
MEREIKLAFDSPEAARRAVAAAGGALLRPRRLQQDALFDSADGWFRQRRSLLRVRQEGDAAILTFKGPVEDGQPRMKARQEIETPVADAAALLRVLDEMGFRVWFRYEKYREEFSWQEAVIAVDETPVGVFVEIEGSEQAIDACAAALGRGPSDYLLDSYRGLFLRHCAARGVEAADMLFGTARHV